MIARFVPVRQRLYADFLQRVLRYPPDEARRLARRMEDAYVHRTRGWKGPARGIALRRTYIRWRVLQARSPETCWRQRMQAIGAY